MNTSDKALNALDYFVDHLVMRDEFVLISRGSTLANYHNSIWAILLHNHSILFAAEIHLAPPLNSSEY